MPAMRTGLGALAIAAMLMQAGAVRAEQALWRVDNLHRIGGRSVTPEGHPTVVQSPVGKALAFDGKDDSVFVDGRPLVGAKTFTIEAVFRPDGGAFQQRVIHMAETDPATGQDALPTGTNDPNGRFMFEVRVVDGGWYLDGFVQSRSGQKALADKTKLHPLGRWYAVAQTFDGTTYRTYVDGVLQGEAPIAFTPLGPGHVRIGSRMNHVDHFHGAVAEVRFTDRALSPDEFLKLPK